MRLILIPAAAVLASLAACGPSVHVAKETDAATGITVTTVAVDGCGSPSQTLTWVQRPGHKEDSFPSTGPDLCNAMVHVGGQVGASAALPTGVGTTINNSVQSGSMSSAQQSTQVGIGASSP